MDDTNFYYQLIINITLRAILHFMILFKISVKVVIAMVIIFKFVTGSVKMQFQV